MTAPATWALSHLDATVTLLRAAWWVLLVAGLGVGTLAYLGLRGRSPAAARWGLVLPLVLSAAAVYMSLHARADAERLQGCRNQVASLAGAIDAYAQNNDGHLPKRLEDLTPSYMRTLPRCPAAGRDTYSSSYQLDAQSGAYTLTCRGSHHQLLAPLQADVPSFSCGAGVFPPETP